MLAQKYGYELPRIEDDPNYEMFTEVKDPRQIFYGLEPGWVVNLPEQLIIKPLPENDSRRQSNAETAEASI